MEEGQLCCKGCDGSNKGVWWKRDCSFTRDVTAVTKEYSSVTRGVTAVTKEYSSVTRGVTAVTMEYSSVTSGVWRQ